MSSASLDRGLAVLLVATAATGLLTLRAGGPGLAWVFVAHGLVGMVLLVSIALKLRGSMPRAVRAGHRGRLAVGALVTVVALASVLGGFASVASGTLVVIGPWTLITWHVAAGIALAGFLLLHLAPRRWRLLVPGRAAMPVARRRLSRRSLLAATALGAVGVGLWATAEALDRVLGGVRRFTSSRWLPPGGAPPATTFFGDTAPSIDPATWRLSVGGAVARPATYDLDSLAALGVERRIAVLDCTSGWAHETEWSGIPLARLLEAAGPRAGAGRVVVHSATGWGATIGLAEASLCLLATGVAGIPLPAGNGAPCRLVVPDRRGLDWVKWVTRVEVLTG